MSKYLVQNINPTMPISVFAKIKKIMSPVLQYRNTSACLHGVSPLHCTSGKLQKVDLEGFMENLDSTDDESDSEENRTSPNESEFSQGQVYYCSLGKQVHVYPENVGGDVEVTVI